MKAKLNKYKCALCKKIIKRRDTRQWIKSDCVESGEKTTRLILIKK
jgi:hypothetical protein